MNHPYSTIRIVDTPLIAIVILAVGLFCTSAQAATPGIQGTVFNLVAAPASITQPDGAMIYSWGYGCSLSFTPKFVPFDSGSVGCPTMQVPGPTLIVTEGDTITVSLTNNLPMGAGNTSIAFPGFQVTATCTAGSCPQGLQTMEAAQGSTVTYTFFATSPGTRAYYSGTQSDLQIEMGLYGAIVVVPDPARSTYDCQILGSDPSQQLGGKSAEYRLAPMAYDHPGTCYDREYLFQFMELDPVIHRQAEEQASAIASCVPSPDMSCPTQLNVITEPYHPRYFLINGRSMPDDMDPDYAPNYPHQPYNGNPHMHPGDLTLLRTIGQGHAEHPFHEHGNHVRILARDGNLILSQNDLNAGSQPAPRLGGRMEFTTDTFPGQAYDGIFYWTGKGLGWDIYGHTPGNPNNPPCLPDSNGFNTVNGGASITAANYYEWCADHNHPLESNPLGQVGRGGPVTQFDPQIATNGLWYNGSPYLGQDAVRNSSGPTPLPPSSSPMNSATESGIAFMWHSHNEREITTNDVFPGGMLMMMLVDPSDWFIDETL